MLLHFVPRLLADRFGDPECTLIDFQCPALKLNLRNDIELVARRPYLNKNYLVACRKIGQRAMNGFLVETTERVREFTTLTRWAVGTDRIITHQVQYFVLDDDLDAITDYMLLWYAQSPSLGGFSSRVPAVAKDWTPATAQPRMELFSSDRGAGHYVDRLDDAGRVIERSEVFQLHTVERERVLYGKKSSLYDRIPTADMAFRV